MKFSVLEIRPKHSPGKGEGIFLTFYEAIKVDVFE
jgi:hypothetical protein